MSFDQFIHGHLKHIHTDLTVASDNDAAHSLAMLTQGLGVPAGCICWWSPPAGFDAKSVYFLEESGQVVVHARLRETNGERRHTTANDMLIAVWEAGASVFLNADVETRRRCMRLLEPTNDAHRETQARTDDDEVENVAPSEHDVAMAHNPGPSSRRRRTDSPADQDQRPAARRCTQESVDQDGLAPTAREIVAFGETIVDNVRTLVAWAGRN